jgi:hypothetical protein
MADALPRFKDGDVEIRLSNSGYDTFVLHSFVLALHSPWFKASLSDRWNLQNAAVTGAAPTRWVYELRFDKGTSFGLLSKAIEGGDAQAASTELHMRVDLLADIGSARERGLDGKRGAHVDAHRQLLQALYYTLPAFHAHPLADSIEPMHDLLNVAIAYGSVSVVRDCIESQFKRDKPAIYNLEAHQHMTMLEMAIILQSELLFREAVTAVTASDEDVFNEVVPKLKELNVLGLLDAKRAKRVDRLRAAMVQMFAFQAISPRDATNIAAIDLFRQWLSEKLAATIDQQMGPLGPNYFEVY